MKEYDVVVVGGGPAGLSAALVLLRARRTVVLVDAGTPRNAPASHLHGFLSRDGMPPRELLAAGRAEVSSYGGRLIDDTVTASSPASRYGWPTPRDWVPAESWWPPDSATNCQTSPASESDGDGTCSTVPTATATRSATSPSACSGAPPRLSSTRCWCGSGRPTSPCSHTATPSARRSASDQLHGVELRDGTVIPRTAVFVRPRFVPNAELLTGLGCAVDEHGWVVHDPVGRTSVAGVWVAGNAVDRRAQVISAAGEGSAAAIALNADLVDEDLQRALADHRAGHTASAPAHPTPST